MPFNFTVPAVTATVWHPSPVTTTSPSPSRLISTAASTSTCAACQTPQLKGARVTYSLRVCARGDGDGRVCCIRCGLDARSQGAEHAWRRASERSARKRKGERWWRSRNVTHVTMHTTIHATIPAAPSSAAASTLMGATAAGALGGMCAKCLSADASCDC